MALTDTGQKFRDAFAATFGGAGNTTEGALLDNMTQIRYVATRGLYSLENADAALTTVHSYTLDPNTSVRMQITSAQLTPTNTLTAANTHTATFSLVYNNGNGGSDTTIATINTATTAAGGSGNWTAGIPVSLTITAANAVVPAGSLLAWKCTKDGNGAATPTYSACVKAKPI